ncbi:MAG: nucleoside deaminase [Alphaproteobacteria bacterium]|nr:MAG: nucleoside deaminase [Alphaproteobacteria bacterium]
MSQALEQARKAALDQEVPVGAVLVDGRTGKVVAATGNAVESLADPTAHAEILVLREGARILGAPRLPECDLYVTLEPCAMCAAAISHTRIRRLYYGAPDPKGGAIEHGPVWFSQPTCHHRPEVYSGIQETECGELLKEFFRQRR